MYGLCDFILIIDTGTICKTCVFLFLFKGSIPEKDDNKLDNTCEMIVSSIIVVTDMTVVTAGHPLITSWVVL